MNSSSCYTFCFYFVVSGFCFKENKSKDLSSSGLELGSRFLSESFGFLLSFVENIFPLLEVYEYYSVRDFEVFIHSLLSLTEILLPWRITSSSLRAELSFALVI